MRDESDENEDTGPDLDEQGEMFWTNPLAIRKADRATSVPWARQPGEPSEAFGLFGAYLSYESDNVQAFGRAIGRNVGQIAARWRWKARRAALEHYLTAERTEAMAAGAREAGRLHAAAWALALDWAVESILHARAAGVLLDPKDALAFLDKAFAAQRLMAGEVQGRIGLDLARASTVDLEALDELLDRIGAIEVQGEDVTPN